MDTIIPTDSSLIKTPQETILYRIYRRYPRNYKQKNRIVVKCPEVIFTLTFLCRMNKSGTLNTGVYNVSASLMVRTSVNILTRNNPDSR